MRTISNLVEQLGDEFNVKVLTSDRDSGDISPYPNIASNTWHRVGKAQLRYLSPTEFRLTSLRRILQETEYDLLYLNSILAGLVIRVLLLRRLACIPRRPAIIAPRGNLDVNALKHKASKKRIFLNLARLIGLYSDLEWHVSSRQEPLDIITHFGRQQTSHIHVIPNLVSLPQGQNTKWSNKKISAEARLIYLSRIMSHKGLDIILRALIGVRGAVILDIYGQLEDIDYWTKCQKLIQVLPPQIIVTYKGIASPDQVHDLMRSYHLFVLPTRGENFGHVIVEAVTSGCPILISDRTPWSNVEDYGAGWVVPLTQIAQYSHHIQTVIDMNQEDFGKLQHNVRTYRTVIQQTDTALEKTKVLFLRLAMPNSSQK